MFVQGINVETGIQKKIPKRLLVLLEDGMDLSGFTSWFR